MRIGEVYTRAVTGGSRVRRRSGAGAVTESALIPAVDQVELSTRSLDVSRARTLALGAPDVREDLIIGLKSSIDEGSYSAPSSSVLEKMVRDQAELRF